MRKNVKIATLVVFFFSFFFSILFTLQTRGVLLKAQGPTPTGVPVVPVLLKTTNGSKSSVQLRTFGYATLTPPGWTGSQISGADYVTPSTNTCGRYNLSKTKGKNIGDPNCTFTKDKLYALLQQQDPKHAALWFITIIPGESGYNPTVVGWPPGQASIDAGGAWGLYQMGSSTPAGQAPPARGKNGPLDRGDVNWETQTTNAIGYNRNQKCGFRYWATARSLWGKLSC